MAATFFDTHAHLQEAEFANDLDAVIARAHAAGVGEILLPAVDRETGEAALAIAEQRDGLYVGLGYHPHEAEKLTPADLAGLDSLLARRKVVAVGEIGLDFYRMHSPADDQRRVFATMLDLALDHRLPIAVHCREANEVVRPALVEWAARAAVNSAGAPLGVLHYFSEDVETAKTYVELGFMISVHTSVTHPKAERLRTVVAELPLESLVIETDSPYGAPQAVRGNRNEPAYVVESARKIAEIKGIALETVAATTTANARRLFRLDVPSRERAKASVDA